MTQHVSDLETAEFAEILHRLFAIRSRIQILLPEKIAKARDRLAETHPGGKNSLTYDYALLQQVARTLTVQDRSTSMGELSRALDVPLSSATRIVDWLEESGFVSRLPDPNDRRVVRVALTEEGHSVYKAAEAMFRHRLESWLGRFPPDERRSLIILLGKLVDIILDDTGAN